MRADACLRCGGFPALATGEDHALVAAARLTARARDGYGDHLGRLAERVGLLD
ncbi:MULTISPECIES: hypothetical protein [Streptomycetaceae]|uniref:hypothetical protein n=1 Tax=unclassified Streptomyces TaxID=2593676 RepID=UPI00336F5CDE